MPCSWAVFAQRSAKAHGLFKAAPRATPLKAFELATLGGARARDLPAGAGTLSVGAPADFVLLDTAAYDPFAPAPDAETALARLVFRGSRAAVRATFVAGRRVWGRL